ncbi:helix-turn-helix domain-containing protein [Streptomyces sp. SID3343]|uniref:PucR family transcriptional regulator n=1 Tax=Streptomyces sp. SID3343 TaxID=2690260 RepID=UPI00137122A8|nr:helix-turn-helix domain-containing protein [Streptomyces sp. SID3343]MYV97734.1 PucR family transcriptional regulator [Streptomyces sp. SID3343]
MALGGRPVAPQLRASAPALTRSVLRRLLAELPVYAALPDEELAGDIAEIVQHTLRLFADVIERRQPMDGPDLAPQRISAAQRAEEGVPLDAILTAYQIGVEMCWRETTARARPDELPAVLELSTHLLRLQRELIASVSAAYLEARELLEGDEYSDRRLLLASLLAGEEPDVVAGRTGVRPAARYVVLTLALAAHPDEARPGPVAVIAARRKLRRIRQALDRFTGEPALTALDAAGGTALLAVDAPPPWPSLDALIAHAAESAGTPVTAAAAITEPADIPAAVTRNAEVVRLVRDSGRGPGLYRLADVLLDYQLSRPSAASAGLAGLLAPLDHKPDLLLTLETLLTHDLDRRATAATLHLHPNTVDYRIRRVAALTGLSPNRTSDLHHLNAALVARRCM